MKKRDEITTPDSCLNKAQPDEIVFVLRSKDPAAPAAIRHWWRVRLEMGLNSSDDPKMQSALRDAAEMDIQRGMMDYTVPVVPIALDEPPAPEPEPEVKAEPEPISCPHCTRPVIPGRLCPHCGVLAVTV